MGDVTPYLHDGLVTIDVRLPTRIGLTKYPITVVLGKTYTVVVTVTILLHHVLTTDTVPR